MLTTTLGLCLVMLGGGGTGADDRLPGDGGGEPAGVGPRIARAPALSERGARYGLLTFGSRAATRAWLVVDGEAAYFDRDGDGDLAEAAEHVLARRLPDQDGTTTLEFKLGEVADADGRTRYEVLLIHAADRDGRERDSITVRIDGRLTQDVGGIFGGYALARRPEDVRVLHFNGPLTMTLRPDFAGELAYGLDVAANDLLKPLVPAGAAPGRLGLIIALVGTPGRTPSDFVANQWGGVPDGRSPVAELEFRAVEPGRPPLRARAVLREHSCADGFVGVFEFPSGAAEGPAKLTLSFPDWEDAWAPAPMRSTKVAPASINVRVLRAPEP